VVWAWHKQVQAGITAALNAAGVTTVNFMAAQEKGQIKEAEAAFNMGDTQVLVCSLKAHAEGFTFVGDGHNITDVLFVEQPWHPGNVSQAEDRINRIGREADAVFAHTLIAPGTIDEWLENLIADKWETFKAGADGTIATTEVDEIKRLLMAQLRAKFPTPRFLTEDTDTEIPEEAG
jgi:hypothetical protein